MSVKDAKELKEYETHKDQPMLEKFLSIIEGMESTGYQYLHTIHKDIE